MEKPTRGPGLIAISFSLLLLCGAARAQDGKAQVLGGPDFVEWTQGRWELGVDAGLMIRTQKKSFSRDIDNQRAYDLLVGETVGDEVGEGWVPPPLPGNSTLAGTMKPTPDLGAHVYYQWNRLLAFGLEGGYGLRRDMHLDSQGIYNGTNFLSAAYAANIIHLSAPVKIGPTFGPVKPYVIAGPGAYWVQERAAISFTDPDDPQLHPLEVVHRNRLRLGANVGAGVEYRVEKGLIGLDVAYHKIFAGADHVDFVEPKLRLSVLF